MTTQTMLELSNPFDVYVKKLGYGIVTVIVWGSISSNPQFLVKFYHTGFIRVVDMVDLVGYGNPSAGENLIPDIPNDWLTEDDFKNKHKKR